MAMTEQQVQLVIAAQGGDIKSFEELFAIYYGKVYALARMIVRNAGDAEDILQETFITAWRQLSTLKKPPTFSVWIQVIAKNLCNMQLRKKSMAILLDSEQDIENFDMEESEGELPAVYAERADLKERLSAIIDDLSEVQRQAIVLYYFNELSVEEIADVMECSVNTVKTRLFLARKAIRSEVEERERKSGEKFYGIAGIPMLPFGKLIQSNIEAQLIGQSAANASLNTITEKISNTSNTNTTAGAAETVKMEGNKMFKNLSLTTKIIAGVSAVAAVGAIAVLVVLLVTGGGGKTDTPADGDPTPDASLAETIEESETPEPDPTPEPTDPTAPVVPTDDPTPSATPDTTATPTASPTASPTTSPAATTAPPQSTTWSYAHMVNWVDTGTAYKSFAFVYMDWFTGTEAVTKYMQDFGCSKEEAENETEEYGYIRNAGKPIMWYYTTSSTKYYLPNTSMAVTPGEVNNNTFNNTMIPAIENDESWLTFVKVTVSGENIVKVEWVHHP